MRRLSGGSRAMYHQSECYDWLLRLQQWEEDLFPMSTSIWETDSA